MRTKYRFLSLAAWLSWGILSVPLAVFAVNGVEPPATPGNPLELPPPPAQDVEVAPAAASKQPPRTTPAQRPQEGLPGQEVTIVEYERGTVQEYRLHGRLYMVKVIPKHGVPYYMVDTTGDGLLNSRLNDLDPQLWVPQWILFSW